MRTGEPQARVGGATHRNGLECGLVERHGAGVGDCLCCLSRRHPVHIVTVGHSLHCQHLGQRKRMRICDRACIAWVGVSFPVRRPDLAERGSES
jgi:hypothetical protein